MLNMSQTIKIKVIPRASKNELIKLNPKEWKTEGAPKPRTVPLVSGAGARVKLTQAPVDNKANLALIKFLAGELNLKKSQIQIIKGEKSREKIIEISA